MPHSGKVHTDLPAPASGRLAHRPDLRIRLRADHRFEVSWPSRQLLNERPPSLRKGVIVDLSYFKPIPGYEKYGVTPDGCIKSLERDLVMAQYLLNGYYIVDTFRGSLTETLPVHRAVALAWVENPDPETYYMVNHKDGNPLNNWWQNLEWTDHSGNNYHAVNNGLRKDNIRCRVRNFQSGKVSEFSSLAQAAEFMGLGKDTPYCMLQPKRFGALIADLYELRYSGDATPWFYEDRKGPIGPSRYMVTVSDKQGKSAEYFSARQLLREFQLYGSPYGKSIPALVQFGREKFPGLEFELRDSFTESKDRVHRQTAKSTRFPLKTLRGDEEMEFESLEKAARHFSSTRPTILKRITEQKELDGWKLIRLFA